MIRWAPLLLLLVGVAGCGAEPREAGFTPGEVRLLSDGQRIMLDERFCISQTPERQPLAPYPVHDPEYLRWKESCRNNPRYDPGGPPVTGPTLLPRASR